MTSVGYPVWLHLDARRAVVVGGGAVATRRLGGLLTAGARVRLVAPEVTPELAAAAACGEVDWHARDYRSDDVTGAAVVLAAAVPAVNRAVAADAAAAGVPVNVADDPARGTFSVPASLHRGALSLAVSTAGLAPGLAGALRRRLESRFGPEWADLVELLGQARDRLPPAADRAAWSRLLDQPSLLRALRRRDLVRARELLEQALAPFGERGIRTRGSV